MSLLKLFLKETKTCPDNNARLSLDKETYPLLGIYPVWGAVQESPLEPHIVGLPWSSDSWTKKLGEGCKETLDHFGLCPMFLFLFKRYLGQLMQFQGKMPGRDTSYDFQVCPLWKLGVRFSAYLYSGRNPQSCQQWLICGHQWHWVGDFSPEKVQQKISYILDR